VAVRKQLMADQPVALEHRFQLAITLNGLGQLYGPGMKKLPEAAEALAEAQGLLEGLHLMAPHNPAYQSELAQTLFNLCFQADFDKGFGLATAKARQERAGILLERAADLLANLVRDHPEVSDYQYRLAATYQNQAVVRNNLYEPMRAKEACEKAIPFADGLVRAHPDIATYQNRLALVRIELASSQAQLGDYKAGAEGVRSATMGKPLMGLALFNGAGAYINCSKAAKADSKLSQAEKGNLTTHYLDLAMGLLLQAEQTDWAIKAQALELLENDPEMALLGQRSDFRALVSRLKERAKQSAP
jgi:hypothetical protein